MTVWTVMVLQPKKKLACIEIQEARVRASSSVAFPRKA